MQSLRIMHPTTLSRRYAPAASVQSVVLPHAFGLRGFLLSQGGPGVRQELRQKRSTARRIGGCDNPCDGNDAQPDRFSHGQRGRDVLKPPERLQDIASKACDAQPDPKRITFAAVEKIGRVTCIITNMVVCKDFFWQDFWHSHAPRALVPCQSVGRNVPQGGRNVPILPTHQFGPQSLDPVARAPNDPRPSR
jgi:hypothetical protein